MNETVKVAQEVSTHQRIDSKMGRMLLNSGRINSAEFKLILQTQATRGLRFGDAALSLGLANTADINAVLAQQFAYTKTPEAGSLLDSRLFVAYNPQSQRTEAMRSLRCELQLRYFNHSSNLSLALIGSDDDFSIALTAANLAIAFAQLGKKTLLIDCNLRKPQLQTLFGLDQRKPGLTDLIAGRASTMPTAISELGSLWVMSAGTEAPNPQELLASSDYAEQISNLSQDFDLILLSTPPLNKILDAQLVAANAGAALVVVKENVTRLPHLETVCNRLRSLGVRLLGAALHQ